MSVKPNLRINILQFISILRSTILCAGTVLKALASKTGKVNQEGLFDDSEHWLLEEDEDEEVKTHANIQVEDDKC